MKFRTRHIKLAKRFIVMKTLGWWGMAAALLILVTFTPIESLLLPRELNIWGDLAWEEAIFLAGIAVILLSKTIYFALYRRSFSLTIRNSAIFIAKGVCFRRHCSIPLNKISHAELGYDLVHLIVGLYFVRIRLPYHGADSSEESEYRIEGLQKKHAIMLHNILEQNFQTKDGNVYAQGLSKGTSTLPSRIRTGLPHLTQPFGSLN